MLELENVVDLVEQFIIYTRHNANTIPNKIEKKFYSREIVTKFIYSISLQNLNVF